jgi:hypothetical protein
MTTRYDKLVVELCAAARPERPAPRELASYLEKVRSAGRSRRRSISPCAGRQYTLE